MKSHKKNCKTKNNNKKINSATFRDAAHDNYVYMMNDNDDDKYFRCIL